MKDNKRFQQFPSTLFTCITLIIIYAISCTAFYYENKLKTDISTTTLEDRVRLIVIDVLDNDGSWTNPHSHLTDEETITLQSFIKEHEQTINNYGTVPIGKGYSIFIKRSTRDLYVQDDHGMERCISGPFSTIDHNFKSTEHYDSYDIMHAAGNTFAINKNEIVEWHLGEEIAKYEVPIENPKLLYSWEGFNFFDKRILITNNSYQNAPLILMEDNKTIIISSNYSHIPVITTPNAIYFIEDDLSLYMYNICTKDTTYIAGNVYELFESTGINYRSTDGVFRINVSVDENGVQTIKDEYQSETTSMVSKWED